MFKVKVIDTVFYTTTVQHVVINVRIWFVWYDHAAITSEIEIVVDRQRVMAIVRRQL